MEIKFRVEDCFVFVALTKNGHKIEWVENFEKKEKFAVNFCEARDTCIKNAIQLLEKITGEEINLFEREQQDIKLEESYQASLESKGFSFDSSSLEKLKNPTDKKEKISSHSVAKNLAKFFGGTEKGINNQKLVINKFKKVKKGGTNENIYQILSDASDTELTNISEWIDAYAKSEKYKTILGVEKMTDYLRKWVADNGDNMDGNAVDLSKSKSRLYLTKDELLSYVSMLDDYTEY